LLANFEVFSNAEGGVKRLRELVHDFAIRGLLTKQLQGDLPIEPVIRSVIAESALGESSQPSNGPFDLRRGWSWAKLGQLCAAIHYGYTASATTHETGVRLLRITDIQDDRVDWPTVPYCEIEIDRLESYRLNDGDILIARTGATIGKTYLVKNLKEKAVFASYLIRAVPMSCVTPDYLKVFAGSSLYWKQLYAGAAGTGQPNVNATTLKSITVSVPPLAEQKRIVAKVDELMKLCDELEARQAKQRETGARLTKSALDALATAEGPEELAVAWERVVGNFEGLVSRADDVKKVRETVLSLAVRGRLVEQKPSEGNGDDLLTQIAQKRATC
jgi:type I restriction enzyme, S subunit